MAKEFYTLITGASEGFGKALAIECAKRGMNLILVSLPGIELVSLSNFIHRCCKVKVITFGKDLSDLKQSHELYEEVKAMHLSVNVLINNAGRGSSDLFRETGPGFIEKQINLNVGATTLLTRLFLEDLIRNKPAYILNVSSLSSLFFLPRKTVYGGTKAYIRYFSKSLRKELQSSGVSVSVICPGALNTNPAVTLINKSSNWLTRNSSLNPEDVAPIAINGLLKCKEEIIPGKINRVYKIFNWLIPAFIKKTITSYGMYHLHMPSAIEECRKSTELPAGSKRIY